jgi:ubiquinone/menaquinone biosynthesis C-methylase UbiE
MSLPLDPQRFAGTAAFYERYRLAFPDRLIRRVAGLAGLNPGDAVLDLGCGSGMLAIPFARGGMAVTAMDPEPEMLAAARKAADAAGVTVTLRQASSFDLTPDMGPFRLVVIGRAFHWMDRAATLAMLDRIVTPDGGVALFHDAHPPVKENGWFKMVCDISARHRARGAERGGGHRRYEPFLLASAFTQLDGLSVTIRRPVSVDEIVGRAFSMSASVSDRDALAGELTAALRESSPDGKFTEVAELVALLARRSR